MSTQPIVLFYGNTACQATELLYQAIRGRDRCRTLYLEQARFPREAPFLLTVGPELSGDYIEVWDEAIPVEAVRSICVNGFTVPADRFADLDETDLAYAQTETWATLHALLASWHRRTLVVNRLAERDALQSRFAELWMLAAEGLAVPPLLVTSDPQKAHAFRHAQARGVLYKSVYGQGSLRPVGDAEVVRLDSLAQCPIHLEAAVAGPFRRAVLVGQELLVSGAGPELPDDVSNALRRLAARLDLHLAELHLIHDGERWVAVRLIPFVSVTALEADVHVQEQAVALLEQAS